MELSRMPHRSYGAESGFARFETLRAAWRFDCFTHREKPCQASRHSRIIITPGINWEVFMKPWTAMGIWSPATPMIPMGGWPFLLMAFNLILRLQVTSCINLRDYISR